MFGTISETKYPVKRLADFAHIKHGFAFKGEFFTEADNGILLVTPGNFSIGGGFQYKKCKFFTGEYADDYVLHTGDLIVTMTDLSKESDTLGNAAIVPDDGYVYLHNQRIGLFDQLDKEIDKTYLEFYMRTDEYRKHILSGAAGSTVKHTSPTKILEAEFILPPLEKQKEFSLIKQQSDKSKFTEHFKSQFIEMFDASNGWPIIKLEQLCDSIVRGPFGSALKVSFFVDKGADTVKVYEQKNAIQSSADIGTSYITQAKHKELKRFSCGPGDFIMSCSGTIGCLYQLPENAEYGIINQALCKFHLNGKMLPEVFLTYMKNSVDQLETKGTAIKNIGAVSFIKNMEIALPPIDVQEQFAEFIKQSDKSKYVAFQETKFIENLLNYTYNHYFRRKNYVH